LIFKCVLANTSIQDLHGKKKVGFHTFLCGEKLDIKIALEFKTTHFEYEQTKLQHRKYTI
jgi:hypothetical protein